MRNPSDREESPWTRRPGGRRPRCALLRLPAAAPELARVPAPEVVPGRGEGRPVPPGRAALCSLGDSISESVGLCICCKLTATIKVDGTRQSITRRSYEKHRGQPPLLTIRLPGTSARWGSTPWTSWTRRSSPPWPCTSRAASGSRRRRRSARGERSGTSNSMKNRDFSIKFILVHIFFTSFR